MSFIHVFSALVCLCLQISPQLPPNFAIQEVLVFDLSILKSVTALLVSGFMCSAW